VHVFAPFLIRLELVSRKGHGKKSSGHPHSGHDFCEMDSDICILAFDRWKHLCPCGRPPFLQVFEPFLHLGLDVPDTIDDIPVYRHEIAELISGVGDDSGKKCGIDFEGMKVRFRIRKIIEEMGWVLDFGFLK